MPYSISFTILQGNSHLLAHKDSFIFPPVGVFMIVYLLESSAIGLRLFTGASSCLSQEHRWPKVGAENERKEGYRSSKIFQDSLPKVSEWVVYICYLLLQTFHPPPINPHSSDFCPSHATKTGKVTNDLQWTEQSLEDEMNRCWWVLGKEVREMDSGMTRRLLAFSVPFSEKVFIRQRPDLRGIYKCGFGHFEL